MHGHQSGCSAISLCLISCSVRAGCSSIQAVICWICASINDLCLLPPRWRASFLLFFRQVVMMLLAVWRLMLSYSAKNTQSWLSSYAAEALTMDVADTLVGFTRGRLDEINFTLTKSMSLYADASTLMTDRLSCVQLLCCMRCVQCLPRSYSRMSEHGNMTCNRLTWIFLWRN